MPYIGNPIERRKALYAQRKSQGLCCACGQLNSNPSFYRCPNCKQTHNEKHYQKSQERIKTNICCQCGKNPIDSSRSKYRCSKCLNKEKELHFAQRDKRNAKSRNYQHRLKDEVLAAYGGPICKCCGEANKMLLTIDHLENNGMEHRRAIKTFYIYPWLKKHNYPPGYQVLCFSCNHGRHLNGGTQCPAHEEHAKIKLHRVSERSSAGQTLGEFLSKAIDKNTDDARFASA